MRVVPVRFTQRVASHVCMECRCDVCDATNIPAPVLPGNATPVRQEATPSPSSAPPSPAAGSNTRDALLLLYCSNVCHTNLSITSDVCGPLMTPLQKPGTPTRGVRPQGHAPKRCPRRRIGSAPANQEPPGAKALPLQRSADAVLMCCWRSPDVVVGPAEPPPAL